MKKIALVLTLVASCVAFVGCSSSTTSADQSAQVSKAPAQHDYKGEVSSKK